MSALVRNLSEASLSRRNSPRERSLLPTCAPEQPTSSQRARATILGAITVVVVVTFCGISALSGSARGQKTMSERVSSAEALDVSNIRSRALEQVSIEDRASSPDSIQKQLTYHEQKKLMLSDEDPDPAQAHLRSGPSQQPVTCKDDNDHCVEWARGGECHKNHKFMLKVCRLSCGECGDAQVPSEPAASGRIDSHQQCSTWAAQGECKRNPAYMMRACSTACGGERNSPHHDES